MKFNKLNHIWTNVIKRNEMILKWVLEVLLTLTICYLYLYSYCILLMFLISFPNLSFFSITSLSSSTSDLYSLRFGNSMRVLSLFYLIFLHWWILQIWTHFYFFTCQTGFSIFYNFTVEKSANSVVGGKTYFFIIFDIKFIL
jgi:hypothetical protein